MAIPKRCNSYGLDVYNEHGPCGSCEWCKMTSKKYHANKRFEKLTTIPTRKDLKNMDNKQLEKYRKKLDKLSWDITLILNERDIVDTPIIEAH